MSSPGNIQAAIEWTATVPDLLYKYWLGYAPIFAQNRLHDLAQACSVHEKYLICLFIWVFFSALGKCGSLLILAVNIVLPVTRSLRALEGATTPERLFWLKYWVIFGVANCVEFIVPSSLARVLSLWFFKATFLLWCVLPMEPNGTLLAYDLIASLLGYSAHVKERMVQVGDVLHARIATSETTSSDTNVKPEQAVGPPAPGSRSPPPVGLQPPAKSPSVGPRGKKTKLDILMERAAAIGSRQSTLSSVGLQSPPDVPAAAGAPLTPSVKLTAAARRAPPSASSKSSSTSGPVLSPKMMTSPPPAAPPPTKQVSSPPPGTSRPATKHSGPVGLVSPRTQATGSTATPSGPAGGTRGPISRPDLAAERASTADGRPSAVQDADMQDTTKLAATDRPRKNKKRKSRESRKRKNNKM